MVQAHGSVERRGVRDVPVYLVPLDGGEQRLFRSRVVAAAVLGQPQRQSEVTDLTAVRRTRGRSTITGSSRQERWPRTGEAAKGAQGCTLWSWAANCSKSGRGLPSP